MTPWQALTACIVEAGIIRYALYGVLFLVVSAHAQVAVPSHAGLGSMSPPSSGAIPTSMAPE
jgi:hypothetical protein